ncbi:hypothetical protein ACSSS7_008444 [Eimeria intestinalis]
MSLGVGGKLLSAAEGPADRVLRSRTCGSSSAGSPSPSRVVKGRRELSSAAEGPADRALGLRACGGPGAGPSSPFPPERKRPRVALSGFSLRVAIDEHVGPRPVAGGRLWGALRLRRVAVGEAGRAPKGVGRGPGLHCAGPVRVAPPIRGTAEMWVTGGLASGPQLGRASADGRVLSFCNSEAAVGKEVAVGVSAQRENGAPGPEPAGREPREEPALWRAGLPGPPPAGRCRLRGRRGAQRRELPRWTALRPEKGAVSSVAEPGGCGRGAADGVARGPDPARRLRLMKWVTIYPGGLNWARRRGALDRAAAREEGRARAAGPDG